VGFERFFKALAGLERVVHSTTGRFNSPCIQKIQWYHDPAPGEGDYGKGSDDMMSLRIPVLLAGLMISAGSQAQVAACFEGFDDPLGDWHSNWLYLNTNLQSYYVPDPDYTCDPDFRGNQAEGIWITDDKDCNTFDLVNPVRINFNPELADNAINFSLDAYACGVGTTLTIYDKNGAVDAVVDVSSACGVFTNHAFNLTNGLSAIEWDSPNNLIEGFNAIDNVEISGPINCSVTGIPVPPPEVEIPVPTLREWSLTLLAGLLGLVAWGALRRRRASAL
jgi:hypothetical protein